MEPLVSKFSFPLFLYIQGTTRCQDHIAISLYRNQSEGLQSQPSKRRFDIKAPQGPISWDLRVRHRVPGPYGSGRFVLAPDESRLLGKPPRDLTQISRRFGEHSSTNLPRLFSGGSPSKILGKPPEIFIGRFVDDPSFTRRTSPRRSCLRIIGQIFPLFQNNFF